MIPYEELCEALARWRAKNGLTGGGAAARRVSGVMTSARGGEDDTALHESAPPAYDDDGPPRPSREDSTNEIDVDSVEVVGQEEDDV